MTISDSLSLVLLLNGRLDFRNCEITEFQSELFLFSLVLGSVIPEEKVSSLNKFEEVFYTKAFIFKTYTYRRYA